MKLLSHSAPYVPRMPTNSSVTGCPSCSAAMVLLASVYAATSLDPISSELTSSRMLLRIAYDSVRTSWNPSAPSVRSA